MHSYATKMLITHLDHIIHSNRHYTCCRHPKRCGPYPNAQCRACMATYRAGTRLFALATHSFRHPYVSLSRVVQQLATVCSALIKDCELYRPMQIVMPTRIAPWVIVSARHAVVVRDSVLLAMLAALRTFPSVLAIQLQTVSGIFQLVVLADTCALAHRQHPYFRATQRACTHASLACWTQQHPPAWYVVGPAINLAKRRQLDA